MTKKYNIICATPVKHLPGILDKLKLYGHVDYFPTLNKDQLKIRLLKKRYDILFINPNTQGYFIDSKILSGSSIKVINTCSTGTNHIDLVYCKNNNIKVLSLKNDKKLIKNLPSTSELAFGLMINLLRKIPQSSDSVKKGNWSYLPYVGRQIKDLRVSVIGYGRLGEIFCKQLEGFNAKIQVVDPYISKCKYKILSLNNAIKTADVIVLHVHLSKDTYHLLNSSNLKLVNKNTIIINTSRGEIVDEKAIISLIKKKKLAGYATDVISDELGKIDKNIVIKAFKEGLPVLITPHIGGMTYEGQSKAYEYAIKKMKKLTF